MTQSSPTELEQFMQTATMEMAAEYERIRRRTNEDPGTAGDQGEENWASLFREWLPNAYKVVTKGRILGYAGVASPQVDVLILSPAYPPALLDKKLYLAAGVVAAFECKTTLRAGHIEDAIRNAVEIRRLPVSQSGVPYPDVPRRGSPYRELHSPIIYGLLAHAHSWSVETAAEHMQEGLVSADLQHVKHPREMLDLICVASLGVWAAYRSTWLGPGMNIPWSDHMASLYGTSGSAQSGYVGSPLAPGPQPQGFTPIGAMLSHLLQRMAWEDPGIRSIARYFMLTGLGGSAAGGTRAWDKTIYSSEVQEGLASRLRSGVLWHEWSIVF